MAGSVLEPRVCKELNVAVVIWSLAVPTLANAQVFVDSRGTGVGVDGHGQIAAYS